MKVHILVVEDDASFLELTREVLAGAGYKVTVAVNAEEGLDLVYTEAPDLLVCDVSLPGMSGIKLCEVLKADARTVGLPVILLTQLSSETDKVRGLETGADDYVTKPFSPRELVARVEALLRRVRYAGAPVKKLSSGRLVVDLERREVTCGGKPLSLRHKEYELLMLLLQHKGKVLGKEFIARALWQGEAIVTSATLNVHVSNLRAALGPCGKKVETLVGEGYRLAD